jgi:hypothetical protein
MARLYADEDFSHAVVQRLRQFGHDVLTSQEAGQSDQGIADAQVLAFAVGRQRAVITFNRRHFIRLHRNVISHFGIIVCTRDSDADALATRIDQEVANRVDLVDQLIRVVRPAQP